MRPYIEKQLININSADRNTGSNTNFYINVYLDDFAEYDKVVILDASIPKSFYSVPSNHTSFTLDENGTEYTISLTPANYTRASFTTALETALNNSGSYTYSISYQNIVTSANGDNGKLTFTVSGNSGIQPIFKFTGPDQGLDTLWEHMGFNRNSSNTFSGDSLTSSNVINLGGETTLFIHSDICLGKNNNILANIYVNNNASLSTINYYCQSPEFYAKNFVKNKSNSYWFYLADEFGEEIDLNGLNIVFTLCLFKQNRIDEQIDNAIKYYIQKNSK